MPDDEVGPTPRSQIRIRTRSGASTWANSTFVPVGNIGCVDKERTEPVESLPLRQRTEHDALRVAHAQDRGGHRVAGHGNRYLPDVLRLPHRRSKGVALAVAREEIETLGTGVGLDRDRRAAFKALRSRHHRARQRRPLPDSSDGLPSALNSRIDAPSIAQLVEDQSVRADAAMAIAQPARQGRTVTSIRPRPRRRREGSRCRRRAP